MDIHVSELHTLGRRLYVWPVEPNEAPHATSYTCSRLTYSRFHRAMFSTIATFRYLFSSAYYFVMQPMYQSSGSGSGQTGNTSVGLKQHWLDSHVSDVRGVSSFIPAEGDFGARQEHFIHHLVPPAECFLHTQWLQSCKMQNYMHIFIKGNKMQYVYLWCCTWALVDIQYCMLSVEVQTSDEDNVYFSRWLCVTT